MDDIVGLILFIIFLTFGVTEREKGFGFDGVGRVYSGTRGQLFHALLVLLIFLHN